MSAFADDLNLGVDDQFDEAGETITLSRGGVSGETTGIPEQANRPAEGGDTRIASADRQFVIRAADYLVGGSTVVPQVGDRITWNSTLFEVQNIANGVDCFELYGSQGYAYRVFTAEIGPA